ncbi:DUF4439 domain-containing protein [Arthrobacter sp. ISL-30]|uniref:DUF4439 domain-containing protein n=1 Tax=Arthrobacter sp. ISL-30 TaxID=2819109 RepID=UPI001BEB85E8|nr:DUF4439 domain-containing protein [Arthrobacter sp. ISL-30]MBT2514286.1 ferritin-like domain-containing protein [Arthrobacter sp. ISL-30]
MTTWTVVIEDSGDKQRPGRTARTILVSLVAVLALGVGVVLTPHPEQDPQPTFSEAALAAAYEDAMSLGNSARLLQASAAESGTTSELLTTQARALQEPGTSQESGTSQEPGTSSPSAASAGTAAPASSTSSPDAAPGMQGRGVAREDLVTGLSSSAARRLADAAQADGGTGRLLAAVGTAQFLEASRLANAWGLAAPTEPASPTTTPIAPDPQATPEAQELAAAGAPATSGGTPEACPSEGSVAEGPVDEGSSNATTPTATPATLGTALSAAVGAELEAVYVYQVAVTRLDPKAGAVAGELLARHQDALRTAEANSVLHCATIPPREAGYRLPAAFASEPAAALGDLESEMLAVYGDLIAVSDGDTRAWAISELLATARRAVAWAIPPVALPGIDVDPTALPPLPSPSTPTPLPK